MFILFCKIFPIIVYRYYVSYAVIFINKFVFSCLIIERYAGMAVCLQLMMAEMLQRFRILERN